jgi:hypothetical protein
MERVNRKFQLVYIVTLGWSASALGEGCRLPLMQHVPVVPITDIPTNSIENRQPPPKAVPSSGGFRQKRVRLPAGGFGYLLSVSLYFSTTSSAGPAAHPKSAPT